MNETERRKSSVLAMTSSSPITTSFWMSSLSSPFLFINRPRKSPRLGRVPGLFSAIIALLIDRNQYDRYGLKFIEFSCFCSCTYFLGDISRNKFKFTPKISTIEFIIWIMYLRPAFDFSERLVVADWSLVKRRIPDGRSLPHHSCHPTRYQNL